MTKPLEWPRVFRTSPWMYALLAVAQAMFTAGALFFRGRPDDRWVWLTFVGFAVFGGVAIAEAATARVALGETELEIVSNFRRRRYHRADLVRVVGEKGVPVAIERRQGGWIRLPSLGSGPHANTVRAWLRGTGTDRMDEAGAR
ncbi:MAG: hypothetical protein AMXMBFR36_25650 [Acidobacteriota bacterium]